MREFSRLFAAAGLVLLATACKSTANSDVKDDPSGAAASQANQGFKCNTMAQNWHEAINSTVRSVLRVAPSD